MCVSMCACAHIRDCCEKGIFSRVGLCKKKRYTDYPSTCYLCGKLKNSSRFWLKLQVVFRIHVIQMYLHSEMLLEKWYSYIGASLHRGSIAAILPL